MTTKLSVSDELTLDHPSIREITSELVTVTPEMATAWLGLNHQNRKQRKRAITNYARDITNGDWLITGESIKFDWNGDLIDGQHRCEAIIDSDTAIQTFVVRNLDPRVKTVLDVNIKRSGADALNFNGVDAYTQLIASIARISMTWDKGVFVTSTSADFSGQYAITNSEVIAWYMGNRDIDDVIHLGMRAAKRLKGTPSAIVFAALLTFRLDPDAATDFWSSVADLRTDGAGDPRLAMADTFQRMETNNLRKRNAMQLSVIFRAWNAWRRKPRKSVRSLPIFGAKDHAGKSTGVSIPEPK